MTGALTIAQDLPRQLYAIVPDEKRTLSSIAAIVGTGAMDHSEADMTGIFKLIFGSIDQVLLGANSQEEVVMILIDDIFPVLDESDSIYLTKARVSLDAYMVFFIDYWIDQLRQYGLIEHGRLFYDYEGCLRDGSIILRYSGADRYTAY